MSKKKTETTIDLPPTWAEMRDGQSNAPTGASWSCRELVEAWGKSPKSTMEALRLNGWICVGKKRDLSMSGDTKLVPMYAPKDG